MKFLVSYTLQGARNAPNRVTMPRASDPNRCRRAELVPESPPRAARRAASARGPAPKTPAAAPAAATPAGSLTRVHCDDSRLEIFRAYSAWIVKGKPRRESPMPIRFLHDRAPAYQGVAKDKAVQEAFDGGVEIAAGKAPDMSHLDAGVCKVMENAVEKEGAQTPDEIRKVVQKRCGRPRSRRTTALRSPSTSGRTCSRWSRGRAEISIRTSCIDTVLLQAC